MAIWNLIGFIAAALVFGFGALTSSENPWVFYDKHAILIVIGGSIAAAAISFRGDRIIVLFKIFLVRMFGKSVTTADEMIVTMVEAGAAYSRSPQELLSFAKNSNDYFLFDAASFFVEAQVSPNELARILSTRRETIFDRYMEDAGKIRAIAKFPPAFGLLGTTLGMIALLQKLGEPGAASKIGPAMAIGLVATLYGISITNFLLSPVAESLTQQAREIRLKNTIIVEGMRLIAKGTNSVMLTEELNSLVLPAERMQRKKGGAAGTRRAA